MKYTSKVLLFLCLVGCMVNCLVVPQLSATDVFEENEIVPDLLPVAPPVLLEINFGNGLTVEAGVELTPSQVRDIPLITWDAKEDTFYTIVFIDPDAPSRADPHDRSFLHWVVGNILGSDLDSGEELYDFISSGPPPDSGLHRYVFLIYEQAAIISFEEPDDDEENSPRMAFALVDFCNKYGLTNPIAGNFYQAQWEEENNLKL